MRHALLLLLAGTISALLVAGVLVIVQQRGELSALRDERHRLERALDELRVAAEERENDYQARIPAWAEERFGAVGAEFGLLVERVDAIDLGLEADRERAARCAERDGAADAARTALEERLGALESRVAKAEEGLGGVVASATATQESSREATAARAAAVDAAIAGIEAKLGGVDGKLGVIEGALAEARAGASTLEELRAQVGAAVAAAADRGPVVDGALAQLGERLAATEARFAAEAPDPTATIEALAAELRAEVGASAAREAKLAEDVAALDARLAAAAAALESARGDWSARLDALADRIATAAAPPVPPVATSIELVDAARSMVVLRGGGSVGLRVGLELDAYEGDRAIGRVRVVLVDGDMAAARILSVVDGAELRPELSVRTSTAAAPSSSDASAATGNAIPGITPGPVSLEEKTPPPPPPPGS